MSTVISRGDPIPAHVTRPLPRWSFPRGLPIPAWAHAAGGAGLAVVVAAVIVVMGAVVGGVLG